MASRRPTTPIRSKTGPKKPFVKGPKPKTKNRWTPEEKRVRNQIAESTGKKRFNRRDFEDSLPSDRHEAHPDEGRGGRARFDTPRERFNREDRPRFDRDDRGGRPRFNRDERDERPHFNREDRPRFNRDERDERPRFNRDERPRFSREDRDERPRFNREDRPRFNREDRPRFNRDERDERPRFNREDRPRFNRDERDERPRFNRDERPRFSREDRPRFNRDDREERPRFNRDERDERPRFNRDERPRFNRDDRDDAPAQDTMEWTQAEVVEGGSADTAFADLGLPTKLVMALSAQGLTKPFPIQAITIPDALAGKDVLGRAETGSGKTLGFGLPLLARLDASPRRNEPRAIVLVPTRELAVQVADSLSPLAAGLGLRVTLVAGGMSYNPQLRAFARGVDIVIATPGRMVDLLDQGAADLSKVEVTVLDEADHMADLGFMPAVSQIVDSTPPEGQRLLFSATLDNAVAKLVKKYMHDPVTHEIDSGRASVEGMTHHVLHVQGHDKGAVAAHLVNREGKTIIFVRTQLGADRIARNLQSVGVLAAPLHGGLTQGARVRTLAAFKSGTIPVLVATDVAARGIHVDDVSLVLQLDPPAGPKDYLHRAGRTARAGHEGTVISIAQPNQRRMVQRLLADAGVEVEPMRVTSTDEILSEISGGSFADGAPIDAEEVAALVAPPKPRRREGGRGGDRRGGGRKPFNRRW